MTPSLSSCIVIGGGAAGIFAALQVKEERPDLSVIVLEKSAVFLSKVKISGGGRCNVTHACFDPKQLVQNYPRGSKELLGPFHHFQPRDTCEWFESHGVTLKAEADGRMFPTTNRSQTIIDALLNEAKAKGIELKGVQHIAAVELVDGLFRIRFKEEIPPLISERLILATGSSAEGYRYAEALGHTISPPVPSLFTFNCPTSPLNALTGISVSDAIICLPEISMQQRGIVLITHFGFSGPATLKLSAFAARSLHAKNYKTSVEINWIPGETLESLKTTFKHQPEKTVGAFSLLPKNLWKALMAPWLNQRVAQLSNQTWECIYAKLRKDTYQMEGKTTHKEEFVTCGGVMLDEVDFRTMESRRAPNLFFAGEVLNIDGVTGGFNFQSAWSTGFLAGKAAARK